MCVGPRVVANASHLPGNLHVGLVGLDCETVIGNLAGHNGLGKLSHHRELITKVAIEGFEPFRQRDHGVALLIRDHVAVVDVHHVRGLDEGVRQVLVGGIERVIDLERAAGFGKGTVDEHISQEVPGEAPTLIFGNQSITRPSVEGINAVPTGTRDAFYAESPAAVYTGPTVKAQALHPVPALAVYAGPTVKAQALHPVPALAVYAGPTGVGRSVHAVHGGSTASGCAVHADMAVTFHADPTAGVARAPHAPGARAVQSGATRKVCGEDCRHSDVAKAVA